MYRQSRNVFLLGACLVTPLFPIAFCMETSSVRLHSLRAIYLLHENIYLQSARLQDTLATTRSAPCSTIFIQGPQEVAHSATRVMLARRSMASATPPSTKKQEGNIRSSDDQRNLMPVGLSCPRRKQRPTRCVHKPLLRNRSERACGQSGRYETMPRQRSRSLASKKQPLRCLFAELTRRAKKHVRFLHCMPHGACPAESGDVDDERIAASVLAQWCPAPTRPAVITFLFLLNSPHPLIISISIRK